MRPRTKRPFVLPPLLVLALPACLTPGYGVVEPFGEPPTSAPAPSTGWESSPADAATPLYAWDGSPVGSRVPGSVERTSTREDRALDEQGGSRFVLLELYSRAVQERDEYLLEIEAQNVALEQAEERHAELQRRFDELSAAFDGLGAEKQLLQQENQEIAGRLATAQIRRLEAEKAWLQSAIEWERRASMSPQAPAATSEEEEF